MERVFFLAWTCSITGQNRIKPLFQSYNVLPGLGQQSKRELELRKHKKSHEYRTNCFALLLNVVAKLCVQ